MNVRRFGDMVIFLAMLTWIAWLAFRPASWGSCIWSLWFAAFWFRVVREAGYAQRSSWVNGLDRVLLVASTLSTVWQAVRLLVLS